MVDRYFAEYASYHTDRRNLLCHEIGIPLIVWSAFSLLRLVHAGPVDAGLVAGAIVIVYYLSLDARLAVVALLGIAALYVAARYTPWPAAVAAFVVGWAWQFIGHGYEGQKPAFLKNIVHLLVGPLWICSLAVPARAAAGKR